MKPSSAFSFLALSLAIASYALHRDISANIFLSCVFVIQGLRVATESTQERRALFLIIALSVGILVFAATTMLGGVDLNSPAPFRYKN